MGCTQSKPEPTKQQQQPAPAPKQPEAAPKATEPVKEAPAAESKKQPENTADQQKANEQPPQSAHTESTNKPEPDVDSPPQTVPAPAAQTEAAPQKDDDAKNDHKNDAADDDADLAPVKVRLVINTAHDTVKYDKYSNLIAALEGCGLVVNVGESPDGYASDETLIYSVLCPMCRIEDDHKVHMQDVHKQVVDAGGRFVFLVLRPGDLTASKHGLRSHAERLVLNALPNSYDGVPVFVARTNNLLEPEPDDTRELCHGLVS